jgi:F420-dependent oxidoreductase-like protein
MKLGLQIIKFDWPGSPVNIGMKLAEIGRTADAAGFDSLWTMDHLFQIDRPAMGLKLDEPMLDGYTALSFLAAATARVRLGAMVTAVNYRHPGHLLKIVSNLDVLSGGRAILGLGAGWYEREALGLGLPFPPLKERFEQLEEVLQLFKQVWSGNSAAFNGKHFQLAEPLNNPQPLSQPHPPIVIGGGGEKKTLKLVAQYADACNLSTAMGNAELTRKLAVLQRHCDTVERDYAEIEKTAIGFFNLGTDGISTSDLIRTCRGLAAIGFSMLVLNIANAHDIGQIETIGREVIPMVAEF